MTRRDRAALTLALECLREIESGWDAWGDFDPLHQAMCALDIGGLDASTIRFNVYCAQPHADPWLLRARLALLIRAVLRSDAGDMGRWSRGRFFCASCGETVDWSLSVGPTTACVCPCPRVEAHERVPIRPLWEIAGEKR